MVLVLGWCRYGAVYRVLSSQVSRSCLFPFSPLPFFSSAHLYHVLMINDRYERCYELFYVLARLCLCSVSNIQLFLNRTLYKIHRRHVALLKLKSSRNRTGPCSHVKQARVNITLMKKGDNKDGRS